MKKTDECLIESDQSGVDQGNRGLTEAQLLQLKTAEENLQRAQAVWDSLQSLRLREMQYRASRRVRSRKPMSALERHKRQLQDEKDEANRKLRIAKLNQNRETRTARRLVERALPSPYAVVLKYQQITSLDLCAAMMGVTRSDAIRLLKAGGVDVMEDIAIEWEKKKLSLRQLSEKHGPSPQTISRFIRSTGRQILPRNSNPKYDQDLMKKLFAKGLTTNKIAKEMGISWATVQRARNLLHKPRTQVAKIHE